MVLRTQKRSNDNYGGIGLKEPRTYTPLVATTSPARVADILQDRLFFNDPRLVDSFAFDVASAGQKANPRI